MKNEKYDYFKLTIIIFDIIFFGISWILAYFIRYKINIYIFIPIDHFKNYLIALPLISVLWVFTCYFLGLYKKESRISRIKELVIVFRVTLMGVIVTMCVSYLFREYNFGRTVILISGILNLIFLSFSRLFFKSIELHFLKKGKWTLNTLIVGAGSTGIRTMQKIEDNKGLGFKIVGFLDNEKNVSELIDNIPVLGKLNDLVDIVKKYNIKVIFFAIPELPHKEILNMVEELADFDITINIVSSLFEVLSESIETEVIGDFPIINLKGEKDDPIYETTKRIMDFTLAVIGVIFLLPLFIIIGILIKLDSKGPIIFSHNRVGKDGKIFKLYKFRTMKIDTEPYAICPKDKDDPRITRFGKFLRRSSLDELPQLINVILGDMSLVGPRPEMPFLVEKYNKWQRKRLKVKPGITGLWQILGRKDLPLHENLEYDFYYIKNRSILMDISIIVKTIPALIFGKGAY